MMLYRTAFGFDLITAYHSGNCARRQRSETNLATNWGNHMPTILDHPEVIVKILDYCEMACTMCGQLSQEPRRASLPLAKLQNLLHDVPLSGKRIYLWGGEPLL